MKKPDDVARKYVERIAIFLFGCFVIVADIFCFEYIKPAILPRLPNGVIDPDSFIPFILSGIAIGIIIILIFALVREKKWQSKADGPRHLLKEPVVQVLFLIFGLFVANVVAVTIGLTK